MGQSRPLFVYFRCLQTNNTFFTTNQCETCHVHPDCSARNTNPWPLEHDSSSKTTRPGLCLYTCTVYMHWLYLLPLWIELKVILVYIQLSSFGSAQLPSLPYSQCDQIKIANVYKSRPKMISLEKRIILTSLQKLPNNVCNLGKIIVATALNGCPKCKNSPNLVTLLTVINT